MDVSCGGDWLDPARARRIVRLLRRPRTASSLSTRRPQRARFLPPRTYTPPHLHTLHPPRPLHASPLSSSARQTRVPPSGLRPRPDVLISSVSLPPSLAQPLISVISNTHGLVSFAPTPCTTLNRTLRRSTRAPRPSAIKPPLRRHPTSNRRRPPRTAPHLPHRHLTTRPNRRRRTRPDRTRPRTRQASRRSRATSTPALPNQGRPCRSR